MIFEKIKPARINLLLNRRIEMYHHANV